MTRVVHLARGLQFPAAELATKVTGAFGIRGSGKSSLMSVVCEQLLDAKIQVIVLDPVGVHWALRLAPNGRTPSQYQIPVLGGRHGDLVLAPTAGEVVGSALARSADSCVLDISSMRKGERIRFSGAFFEAFYEGKKDNPAPVLLCLEEAQSFAPQIMYKGSGQEQMLGAIEDLAAQGRNFGAGIWLNSLRPQKINKEITSLMDLVFGFRLTGVHERKSVKDWLQEKGAEGRDEIDGELPGLQAGHAFVWSPAVFGIFGKYHMQQKTTYDAGATPLHAREKVKLRALDLAELEAQMATVVTEVKANDPRVLKAKIAELERVVKFAATAEATRLPTPAKIVEKSVLKPADLVRIERVVERLFKSREAFADILMTESKRVSEADRAVETELAALKALLKPDALPTRGMSVAAGTMTAVHSPRVFMPVHRIEALRVALSSSVDGDGVSLPEKSQRMLGALKQGEAMGMTSMPFRNVAVIAGVAPMSGTTSNRKGALVSAGLVTVSGKSIALTDAGRAYPIDVTLPPTDPLALLTYWKREIGTQKIGDILEVVVSQGPISNDDLMAAVGMANSGTFSNYKGALVGRGLIEKRGDMYVATEPFNR